MSLSVEDTHRLAHLLRRAGFGARPDEWASYSALGLSAATDRLLHPERVPDHLDAVLADIGGDYVDFTNLDSVRQWWLYRMLHTQRPLEEKMTLFWHGHFATATYKVDNPRWMWQQNQLFRANALGNFRTLLQGVSRDPAMLIWLDGVENRKGKANENYGRELLELFTLGIGGGYTETDVKEAARAFTGWRFDRDTGAFVFDTMQHDDGPKTFLGQTGAFGGDDIIDIVSRHPSTAHFLCAKLFKFFVHDAPTAAELAPLTRAYFTSGYEIRAVLAALFQSPAFYSDTARYAHIKSPTEYVVTLLRTLDVPMAAASGFMPPAQAIRAMGQDLFNPPNVKGWPEGKAWVNTLTLMARFNFASRLANDLDQRGLLSPALHACLSAQGLGRAGQLATPDQIVQALWSALLPGHAPSDKTRAALTAFAQDDQHPNTAHFESRAPGLLSLIVSAPEYQLA